MGQRPRLSAELDNLASQPFPDKKTAIDETDTLRVLVKLFYSCTKASPSQRPTVKEIFAMLSEVSGPASTNVDPPFQEEATDVSTNIDETGPNILRPLESGLLEESTPNEAELPCSCGGEKCPHCESKSVLEAKAT